MSRKRENIVRPCSPPQQRCVEDVKGDAFDIGWYPSLNLFGRLARLDTPEVEGIEPVEALPYPAGTSTSATYKARRPEAI